MMTFSVNICTIVRPTVGGGIALCLCGNGSSVEGIEWVSNTHGGGEGETGRHGRDEVRIGTSW